MKDLSNFLALWIIVTYSSDFAVARVWTDTSGGYTLEAELFAVNDHSVVLQRADHELVAIPIDKLSEKDREYLKSKEADSLVRKSTDAMQTWTLLDGTKVVGRFVDYTHRDMTLQRRRGRIYVNDCVLENLAEFYQKLVPQIVAHFEKLQRADRRSLEAWLVRQRAQPRTFHLDGIVLEMENGDEFAVPFFLLSEDDLNVLKPGWNEWLSAHEGHDYEEREKHAFLLRSLAAARYRDKQVRREIAQMNLKLQAVPAGLTSLWEVTLYPPAGQVGPPQWVVVPGRDSRQATVAALGQFPGYAVGPIRRVAE